ncbi:ADK-domain-containing protein [Fomitiporia mediterranea MF3/22]|uniref:ADK-domain-containing protein n=1 Tax=Fomitiporia mediterranea (strain MF3/22) TaxID=694068 RepID=UPI00044086C8|nr:ADK-domain-containing protein [Fomitiporia mediterranea MF3/22]EJD02331.1 ADK-domain-containing protein [Fomitiporia mediterranea MF3/22]
MLRMVMFGKPGAGKGTLTERLVKKFDIVSISTGDLLRQHIAQKTEIGRQAKEIVARGDLLPDELMLQIATSKLDYLHDKHWILDGFPRTIRQGDLLDTHLRSARMPLTLLVTLTVPEPILHARIAGRFVHPGSGRVYNTHFNPPRIAGHDDLTGEPLTQRPDDRPEVYSRRLAAYERATAPLLGYYTRRVEEERASRRGGVGGGLKIVSLAGETSDEMWPILENSVRETFPTVQPRIPVDSKLPKKSRDAVATLSAAAATKKTAREAVEEAVDGPTGKSG